MDDEKKKNLELNIAIILCLLLLVAFFFVNNRGPGNSPSKKQAPQIQPPAPAKKRAIRNEGYPFPEDFKSAEYDAGGAEEEKEKMDYKKEEKEVMSLKDIPLNPATEEAINEAVSRRKEGAAAEKPEDIAHSPPATQPSVEDMKKLRQKGFIIY